MNKNKPIIAERIKYLRKEKGYTQEQLAEILGLNAKSSVANYESGANSPSDDIKLKLCEIFDCSMDYLIGKSNLKVPLSLYENFIFEKIKQYVYSKYLNELDTLELSHEEKTLFLNNLDKVISPGYIDSSIMSSFLENMENKDKATKLSNLFISLFSTFAYMSIKSDEYIPISHNTNTEIINTYRNKVTPNFDLDYESINKLVNIMEEANNLFIDGPKYKNYEVNEPKFYMCPVYGQISAGQPNWAEECIEGRIPIDPVLFNIVDPEEHFFLRVNGESMNKIVNNGGYALIHKQDIVDEGEIAVVLVNGDEATLKRFDRQGDFILLEPMSNDSSFKTQIYDKNTPIKILGKYIGKFEMNK